MNHSTLKHFVFLDSRKFLFSNPSSIIDPELGSQFCSGDIHSKGGDRWIDYCKWIRDQHLVSPGRSAFSAMGPTPKIRLAPCLLIFGSPSRSGYVIRPEAPGNQRHALMAPLLGWPLFFFLPRVCIFVFSCNIYFSMWIFVVLYLLLYWLLYTTQSCS